jgi:NADPH:quinone reductase-like Zn-dependent oxidoreductase
MEPTGHFWRPRRHRISTRRAATECFPRRRRSLGSITLIVIEEGQVKAYAIDELGRPGSVRDLPIPEPGEEEVRVRVVAAGLNPFDHAVVQGYVKDYMEHRFPLVPGMDASGTVEAVGEAVGELAVGDEVFGSVGKSHMGDGTLAELATMSAATVARKPPSFDHRTAAAIPVAGVTALMMADALSLTEGDLVVAVGATGGVGSFLVQLATRRGARVVAVCSEANAAYARGLGAVDVIDYATDDVAEALADRYPDGVHGVAEMHAGADVLARLAEHVRSGGGVVSATGSADAEALEASGIRAVNVQGRVTRERLEVLAAALERGEIVAPELRSFGLSDASSAFEAIGSGHTRGKLVVVP